MSGLEMAAGIIGITDVALKSIKGLYDFFQAYQDVPEELQRFQREITGLQNNLSGLEYLSTADDATRKEVKKTGIADHMNACAATCDEFKRKLQNWTKHGTDSTRSKLRVLLNESSIKKYTARMWTTARLLDSAIGILTLKKTTNTEGLVKKINEWTIEAKREKDQNIEDKALIDEDDDTAVDAEMELDKKDEILDLFLAQVEKLVPQLQQIKLNQIIKDVRTDEEAKAQIGMDDSVADKVAMQDIQKIVTGKKAQAQIGIFAKGKSVFDS